MQAMESRVESVVLNYKVTLDIRDLMEYSGQGICRVVECNNDMMMTLGFDLATHNDDTKVRYREQLRTWAKNRNWEVTNNEYSEKFIIERI